MASQFKNTGLADARESIQPQQLATLGWALRRAALWLAMIVVMALAGAWLLYASIDPDEAAASSSGAAEVVSPAETTGSISK